MNTIMTIWIVGMPFSLFVLLWAVESAPKEDLIEVGTFAGLAALTLWVLLWPVFLAVTIYDVWSERP